jgi:ankyrin repeat protein
MNKSTALQGAFSNDNEAIDRFLLENGADTTVAATDVRTPLHVASFNPLPQSNVIQVSRHIVLPATLCRLA